jgi:hypothetical protein
VKTSKEAPHRSVLEVDEHDLVNEWLRQPTLFHEWAEALASAKNDVDRKEAAFKLVEAQVFARVRENPTAYGLEKATVDSIKYAVIASKQYQAAQEAYLTACEEAAKIDAMVKAISLRKNLLQDLVVLRMNDYYAEPNVPRKFREQADGEKRRRVAARVGGDD